MLFPCATPRVVVWQMIMTIFASATARVVVWHMRWPRASVPPPRLVAWHWRSAQQRGTGPGSVDAAVAVNVLTFEAQKVPKISLSSQGCHLKTIRDRRNLLTPYRELMTSRSCIKKFRPLASLIKILYGQMSNAENCKFETVARQRRPKSKKWLEKF